MKNDNTIKITLRINKETGAVEHVNKQLDETAKKASQAGKQIEGFSSKLKKIALAVGGVYALKKAFDEVIVSGINLHRQIESTTLGISALIAANTTGADSFSKFQQGSILASHTIMDLKKAAVDTAATFPELTTVFQQAIGSALGAGDAMGSSVQEVVNNTIKTSKRMTNIAASIGMPMVQVNEEIRSIMEGTIDMNSRIGKMLNLNNEAIRASKMEVGGLNRYLDNALKDFDILGEQMTFNKSMARIKDSIDSIRLSVSEPIFTLLKEEIKDISTWFSNASNSVHDFMVSLQDSINLHSQSDLDTKAIELAQRYDNAIKDLASSWTTLGKNMAKADLKEIEKELYDLNMQYSKIKDKVDLNLSLSDPLKTYVKQIEANNKYYAKLEAKSIKDGAKARARYQKELHIQKIRDAEAEGELQLMLFKEQETAKQKEIDDWNKALKEFYAYDPDFDDATTTANVVFENWGKTLNSSISNAITDALMSGNYAKAIQALGANVGASFLQSGTSSLLSSLGKSLMADGGLLEASGLLGDAAAELEAASGYLAGAAAIAAGSYLAGSYVASNYGSGMGSASAMGGGAAIGALMGGPIGALLGGALGGLVQTDSKEYYDIYSLYGDDFLSAWEDGLKTVNGKLQGDFAKVTAESLHVIQSHVYKHTTGNFYSSDTKYREDTDFSGGRAGRELELILQDLQSFSHGLVEIHGGIYRGTKQIEEELIKGFIGADFGGLKLVEHIEKQWDDWTTQVTTLTTTLEYDPEVDKIYKQWQAYAKEVDKTVYEAMNEALSGLQGIDRQIDINKLKDDTVAIAKLQASWVEESLKELEYKLSGNGIDFSSVDLDSFEVFKNAYFEFYGKTPQAIADMTALGNSLLSMNNATNAVTEALDESTANIENWSSKFTNPIDSFIGALEPLEDMFNRLAYDADGLTNADVALLESQEKLLASKQSQIVTEYQLFDIVNGTNSAKNFEYELALAKLGLTKEDIDTTAELNTYMKNQSLSAYSAAKESYELAHAQDYQAISAQKAQIASLQASKLALPDSSSIAYGAIKWYNKSIDAVIAQLTQQMTYTQNSLRMGAPQSPQWDEIAVIVNNWERYNGQLFSTDLPELTSSVSDATTALDEFSTSGLSSATNMFASIADSAKGFIDQNYSNNTSYNGSLFNANMSEALRLNSLISSGADFTTADLNRLQDATSNASSYGNNYLQTLDPNSFQYRIEQNRMAHDFGTLQREASSQEKTFADVVKALEDSQKNEQELITLNQQLLAAIKRGNIILEDAS